MEENTQLKHLLTQRDPERKLNGRMDLPNNNTHRENEVKLLREELRNTKAENKILKEHLSKTLSDSYSYKSRVESYVFLAHKLS